MRRPDTPVRVPYERQVFINCPYDDDYRPLLKAAAFAVHACGFRARLALEDVGARQGRLERLTAIIADCGLAIHDISRVEVDSKSALPRFNMAFECGVYFGASRFGTGRQRRKDYLLLDAVPDRHRRTLSDLSGVDPRIHRNEPERMIRCVRDFLATKTERRPAGPAELVTLFRAFNADLPARAAG